MTYLTEHTISQALATAIFNDDYSGLSASDESYISQWLKGYITLSREDASVYWQRCDITGAYADCIVVNQIIEEV
jgi:hypothetical protein